MGLSFRYGIIRLLCPGVSSFRRIFFSCNFGHHQYHDCLGRILLTFLLSSRLRSHVALLINVISLCLWDLCLHAPHLNSSFSLCWCDVSLPFYDGSLLYTFLFLFLWHVLVLLVLLTNLDLIIQWTYLVVKLCHGDSCWELECDIILNVSPC